MQASQLPTLVPLPWANSGTKNSIPVASQVGIKDGAASLTTGFPPLTFTPLAAGGVAPDGADFNGAFNLITQFQVWQSAGMPVQYDSAFATLIGGYPKGAVVATSGRRYRSLADNNLASPVGGGNWTSDDGNFDSALVLTAARVLLPTDAGRIIIPSLVGSYNITLPLVASVAGGANFNFLNVCSQTVNVFPQGGNVINVANGQIASVPLAPGETLQITTETNGWYVIGGSASLKYTAASFGASMGNSGYQRLPSGLIMQWGYSSFTASGVPVLFPIAFPTAISSLAFASGGPSGQPVPSALNTNVNGFTALAAATTAANWIAFGY